MSLFQRQSKASNPISFTSIGLNKMFLLVGLGNVGDEYNLTRHNVGFDAIDEFVKEYDEMSDWSFNSNLKINLSNGKLADKSILAIKPTTYMNLSGEAVNKTIKYYKIPLENVIVMYDDVDLNFGQIRIRSGGSSAGHNGVKSIIENLKTEDFGRIKIGIGPKNPPQIELSDYVLQKFNKEEQTNLINLKKEVVSLLTEHLYSNDPLKDETRKFIF